ncbi:hypothetical protein MMB19_12465 [Ralstonia insidiosa]|nr:hypothetical protein MMB19_12465 [Ralstonia insidiosa]
MFRVGLAVDVPALDGALNFRKRAEKDGELFERSEFSPSPPGCKNSRGSRHLGRAFLLLTFLWQDKEK